MLSQILFFLYFALSFSTFHLLCMCKFFPRARFRDSIQGEIELLTCCRDLQHTYVASRIVLRQLRLNFIRTRAEASESRCTSLYVYTHPAVAFCNENPTELWQRRPAQWWRRHRWQNPPAGERWISDMGIRVVCECERCASDKGRSVRLERNRRTL